MTFTDQVNKTHVGGLDNSGPNLATPTKQQHKPQFTNLSTHVQIKVKFGMASIAHISCNSMPLNTHCTHNTHGVVSAALENVYLG